MTRALSAVDRLLVFLCGCTLLGAGLAPAALYWDVPYASEFVASLDRARLSSLPQSPWYPYALAGALTVALVLGAWLVYSNIRSRAFTTRPVTPADGKHGDTVFHLQRVAQAACEHMSASEVVDNAQATVAMVRDRPTVTFTVTADPGYTLRETVSFVESAERDFVEACGAMDIDTVYKLHLDRIGG
ncbi:hypothetical protein [Corynebacterium qintianiae]|uniref:hypothetical protein n=1 Tax=Corynebacterium qintianiae TaxID=2709392 RepID=UPI0013ED28B2|nr:hypothetical protein [Corynebacterium qintianiae]